MTQVSWQRYPVRLAMSVSEPSHRAPHFRWYRLYFLLATFDLLAIAFSLVTEHRQATLYEDSVAINKQWAVQLAEYARLRRLASEVNAPGNNVFGSLDPDGESLRLDEALGRFKAALATAHQHATSLSDEAGEVLTHRIVSVADTMDSMASEARLTFEQFRTGNIGAAGSRMAVMDRKYASVLDAFERLEATVRAIQADRFEEERIVAESLDQTEYLIGAAILIMIVGAGFYGRMMARTMNAASRERERYTAELRTARDELEERVIERTADLSRTNEALEQEIAERQRAEIALRASEEEVRQLNQDLEDRVRQRTMELASANRELEAFAYSVSHDLRTPLRGIDGWSLALLEDYGDKLDGTAHSYLDHLRGEARRMASLIDDILELSRVARSEMRRRTLDLSELACSIVDNLRRVHGTRVVEVVIAPDVIGYGDAALLDRLLQNLLENAWKFTAPRASAHIEFGTRRIDDEQVYFVADNGVGFDMEFAGKLFAPFQRLHKTSEFPGSGVGLSTAQRIVHRHGGRIWVESAVDEGTTFYFTLSDMI